MIYGDTSVLASLVIKDSHSGIAIEHLKGLKAPLLYNALLKLEIGNATRLGLADNRLKERDVSRSEEMIELMLRSRSMVALEPIWENVWERARGLSIAHTIKVKARSLDILHVAIAMELQARAFWSFDLRQQTLADMAGLAVI